MPRWEHKAVTPPPANRPVASSVVNRSDRRGAAGVPVWSESNQALPHARACGQDRHQDDHEHLHRTRLAPVHSPRRRRAPRQLKLFERPHPGDCVQVDVKVVKVAHRKCFQYTALDGLAAFPGLLRSRRPHLGRWCPSRLRVFQASAGRLHRATRSVQPVDHLP